MLEVGLSTKRVPLLILPAHCVSLVLCRSFSFHFLLVFLESPGQWQVACHLDLLHASSHLVHSQHGPKVLVVHTTAPPISKPFELNSPVEMVSAILRVRDRVDPAISHV